ncbi:MAG: DUF438 domain-containing protein [Dehalococcoidales bacterium]
MANKEELKQLLRELNKQSDSALVKERAADFLKNVDAKTLSLAEQELMEKIGYCCFTLQTDRQREFDQG